MSDDDTSMVVVRFDATKAEVTLFLQNIPLLMVYGIPLYSVYIWSWLHLDSILRPSKNIKDLNVVLLYYEYDRNWSQYLYQDPGLCMTWAFDRKETEVCNWLMHLHLLVLYNLIKVCSVTYVHFSVACKICQHAVGRHLLPYDISKRQSVLAAFSCFLVLIIFTV